MTVNLTNKPIGKWSYKQVLTLNDDMIIDYPFPDIKPDDDDATVLETAFSIADHICSLNPSCVVCNADCVLMFAIICLLKERNVKVVTMVTKRSVRSIRNGNVTQTIPFSVFLGFREYILP